MKKRILCIVTHTLYAKSVIPMIIKLIKAGHEVDVTKTMPEFIKCTNLKLPLSLRQTAVNRHSFEYVAKIIDYEKEWNEVKDKVRFVFSPFFVPFFRKYITHFGVEEDKKILDRYG